MTTKKAKEAVDEVVAELVDEKTGAKTEVLAKRRVGHPGFFNEELGRKLVASAGSNVSIKSVCEQHSVSYSTMMLWLKKGDGGHPDYQEFSCAFHAARNHWKDRFIQNLIAVADDPEQGAACVRANDLLLRKLYPAEFGEQIYVATMIRKEADGYDLSSLPHDELRTFMKTLKALKAANEDNEGKDE